MSQIGLGEYREAIATIDEGLAKSRERNNSFIVGRLTNTLGWLYQELGDFARVERPHEILGTEELVKGQEATVA